MPHNQAGRHFNFNILRQQIKLGMIQRLAHNRTFHQPGVQTHTQACQRHIPVMFIKISLSPWKLQNANYNGVKSQTCARFNIYHQNVQHRELTSFCMQDPAMNHFAFFSHTAHDSKYVAHIEWNPHFQRWVCSQIIQMIHFQCHLNQILSLPFKSLSIQRKQISIKESQDSQDSLFDSVALVE